MHTFQVSFFENDQYVSSSFSFSSVFLFSGLSPVLDRWDLPVAVFPFNIVIVLYLLCTGQDNPYFPHHPAVPAGALEPNGTELSAVEVWKCFIKCLYVVEINW